MEKTLAEFEGKSSLKPDQSKPASTETPPTEKKPNTASTVEEKHPEKAVPSNGNEAPVKDTTSQPHLTSSSVTKVETELASTSPEKPFFYGERKFSISQQVRKVSTGLYSQTSLFHQINIFNKFS